MEAWQTTSTLLLERLRATGDEAIWRAFDARYRPLLERFARRLGVPEADAPDVAQEALSRFVDAYRRGGFHRDRGRLRQWIYGIARNVATDAIRASIRRGGALGGSAVQRIETPDRAAEIWEQEAAEHLVREGMQVMRDTCRFDPQTLRAFERHALDRQPAAVVATELGTSVEKVYVAKHRCLTRLRAIVAELEHAYELA